MIRGDVFARLAGPEGLVGHSRVQIVLPVLWEVTGMHPPAVW